MSADIEEEILNEVEPCDGPSPMSLWIKQAGCSEGKLKITAPFEKGKQVLKITFVDPGVTLTYSVRRIDGVLVFIKKHMHKWAFCNIELTMSAFDDSGEEEMTFMNNKFYNNNTFDIEMMQNLREHVEMILAE